MELELDQVDVVRASTSPVNALPDWDISLLEKQYADYERTIVCKNGQPEAYAHLPHFNGNKAQPIHRWFTYKEGFSSSLLQWICQTIEVKLDDIESLLDPYLGVATSLLSADLAFRGTHDLKLVGIERNPFVAFVAQAKLKWREYDPATIEAAIPMIASAMQERQFKFELVDLSTIQNQEIFNRRKLQDLMNARYVIYRLMADSPALDFFLLGWSSIIETVSNARKDGRALRIVTKDPRPPIQELLIARWNLMLDDLRKTASSFREVTRGEVTFDIHKGDGRTLEVLDGSDEKFDLVFYSPPYLNNIDYSEVYKLELWLNGFVTNKDGFKSLRLSTFRSHPSVRFYETNYLETLPAQSWPRKLLDCLTKNIARDKDYEWRCRLMKAYADDMLLSLSSQFTVAKPGAHVICVVGNSLHGPKGSATPVATDLIIAALAQEVGFSIERLQITRHTNRRSREMPVRESVIIMRRPKS
jgi:hypothetical protein